MLPRAQRQWAHCSPALDCITRELRWLSVLLLLLSAEIGLDRDERLMLGKVSNEWIFEKKNKSSTVVAKGSTSTKESYSIKEMLLVYTNKQTIKSKLLRFPLTSTMVGLCNSVNRSVKNGRKAQSSLVRFNICKEEMIVSRVYCDQSLHFNHELIKS